MIEAGSQETRLNACREVCIEMTEILETIMLVCFGISWPLNVYHNFKARTAKGMSLFFILLIIAGYIAGITAKIISHNFSYVLAVYLLNLLIVSVNLLVYFRNRACDKRREEADRLEKLEEDKALARSREVKAVRLGA